MAQQSTISAKPNIVFIMADDLGHADVSCYGQRDYTTPNIDRLAIEGLRFTQGYANSPDCSATRTALITGRYQARLAVGLEEPISPSTPKNIGLPPSHPTLPSLLKKVGYRTRKSVGRTWTLTSDRIRRTARLWSRRWQKALINPLRARR